jgi:hypothetical protein
VKGTQEAKREKDIEQGGSQGQREKIEMVEGYRGKERGGPESCSAAVELG